MHKIIGNKKIFAIELELSKDLGNPSAKQRIWINNAHIGNFKEDNYLFPLLKCLQRISEDNNILWLDEFEGLNCDQLYDKITPLKKNPDDFWLLNKEEMKELQKYDRFLFDWGASFEAWDIKIVIYNKVSTFLWTAAITPQENGTVNCFSIPQDIIQQIFLSLKNLIPIDQWPTQIDR